MSFGEDLKKSWKRDGMMEVSRGGKDTREGRKGGDQSQERGRGGGLQRQRSQLRLRKKRFKRRKPLPEDSVSSARMHSSRVILCKIHYARVRE